MYPAVSPVRLTCSQSSWFLLAASLSLTRSAGREEGKKHPLYQLHFHPCALGCCHGDAHSSAALLFHVQIFPLTLLSAPLRPHVIKLYQYGLLMHWYANKQSWAESSFHLNKHFCNQTSCCSRVVTSPVQVWICSNLLSSTHRSSHEIE